MDNITHSLVGGIIGVRYARKNQASASLIILASVLANNFPDTDMLYASFLSQPFGYLLHHRGHTHTLLGALICAFLTWGLIVGIAYLTKKKLFRKDLFDIGFVSILGGFIHIGLDFLNTYGVHPFWPFSNKWFYGDTIFIIEPTIWMSLSLAIYPFANNKYLKFLTILPCILGSGLIIFSGKVPIIIVTTIVTILILILFLAFKKAPNTQSNLWIIISILILSTFFICGKIAKTKLEVNQQIVSSFVVPAPANPFCWTYLQMKVGEKEVSYKRGLISLLPFNLNCENYTLYQNVNNNSEYLKTPNNLASNNCRWQAFLRFSRIPSIINCGEASCMTDQRFNRDGKYNFSTFSFDGECPGNLPPWEKIIK